jgi:methyl-accepting chemotaxis protein
MQDGPDTHASFLRLSEAAERLGISRLKLREAIAKGVVTGRRDNEGRLRVDLSSAPQDIVASSAEHSADPAALMQVLFDEIEELSAELEDSQAGAERLSHLADAQGASLERAIAALEAATADRDRLADLTGRALAAAEEAGARAERLGDVAARSLGLLEDATSRVETLKAENAELKAEAARKDTTVAQHASQLERMFKLSEQALEKAAQARREPTLIARVFGAGRGRN